MESHPYIVEAVNEFIEQNTSEAHLRRRSSVMYTNGVSLQEIANLIREKFNFGISKHTIHRLLIPRRKGTTVSKWFKSAVSAWVPPKRNSGERTPHLQFHNTCAQVNLINELSQIHSRETALLSVDNKNKVEIGNPAISRRSSIRKIYLTKDAPNYNEHDFPYFKKMFHDHLEKVLSKGLSNM